MEVRGWEVYMYVHVGGDSNAKGCGFVSNKDEVKRKTQELAHKGWMVFIRAPFLSATLTFCL